MLFLRSLQGTASKVIAVTFSLRAISAAAVAAQATPPQGPDSTLHLSVRTSHEGKANGRAADRRSGDRTHPTEPSGSATSGRAKPGPWGDLEYSTVFLEASTALLKCMEISTYDTEWNFVNQTEDEVARLFASTEMPAPIRAALSDREKWRRQGHAITVVPGSEAVLGLSPEARVAIYSVLTKWEENPYHYEPVVVFPQSVRDWLQHSELPEEIVSTIEKLAYHRGRNLVFADTPLLLRMVPTEAERLKIRKALTRMPTLVVTLHLTPQTDLAAVTSYWEGAKLSPEIAPFLEAMSECGSPAASVDIVHLLPPTPRRLLYTFPTLEFGRTGYYPDCHWTALNFRNPEPLDRLADPALAATYVLENYTKVTGPYRYGDVIFLMDGQTGNAVHSCVYLADDLVFTKNGRSPTQPWVVMKLGDVVSYYEMFYAPQVTCYRHNGE